MTTQAIRTLIFDFGNVIGLFDLGRTLARLLPHTDLSETEVREVVADANLAEDYETGQITSEEFLQRVKQTTRLRCDDALLVSAWCEIFDANEPVCDLIPRLATRYRLILGSNTNDLHARHYRQQFADTLRHFDKLVLSHEIGVMKPDVGFFHRCLEHVTCPPEQCVFIDDRPENIEAALACGLRGIVYMDFPDLLARLAQLGVAI